MTEGGYSGNQRYLIIPTAALAVLAGVGVAWSVRWVAAQAQRRAGGSVRVRVGVAWAVLLLALAATSPVVLSKADQVDTITDSLEYEATLWEDLKKIVDDAGGGPRLRTCGGFWTGAFQTQMVAYETGVHGVDVGLEPIAPGVVFRTKTAPQLGPVPPVRDRSFRPALRNRRWTLLVAPPACGRRLSG